MSHFANFPAFLLVVGHNLRTTQFLNFFRGQDLIPNHDKVTFLVSLKTEKLFVPTHYDMSSDQMPRPRED